MQILFNVYLEPKTNSGLIVWNGHAKEIDDYNNTILIYFNYEPENKRIEIKEFKIIPTGSIDTNDEIDEHIEKNYRKKLYFTTIENNDNNIILKNGFSANTYKKGKLKEYIELHKDNIKKIFNNDNPSNIGYSIVYEDDYYTFRGYTIYNSKENKISEWIIRDILETIDSNIIYLEKLNEIYNDIKDKEGKDFILFKFEGEGNLSRSLRYEDGYNMKLRIQNKMEMISDNIDSSIRLARYIINFDDETDFSIENYNLSYSSFKYTFNMNGDIILSKDKDKYIITPNEIRITEKKSENEIIIAKYNPDNNTLIIDNDNFNDIRYYLEKRMYDLKDKSVNEIVNSLGINNLINTLLNSYKIYTGKSKDIFKNINDIIKTMLNLMEDKPQYDLIDSINKLIENRNILNNIDVKIDSPDISKDESIKEFKNEIMNMYNNVMDYILERVC